MAVSMVTVVSGASHVGLGVTAPTAVLHAMEAATQTAVPETLVSVLDVDLGSTEKTAPKHVHSNAPTV